MLDSQSPAFPANVGSGRYQVRRQLGEGRRKRVYLAYDTRLDSVLRTRVLSCLANALIYSPFGERRAALSREAVNIARRIGAIGTAQELGMSALLERALAHQDRRLLPL